MFHMYSYLIIAGRIPPAVYFLKPVDLFDVHIGGLDIRISDAKVNSILYDMIPIAMQHNAWAFFGLNHMMLIFLRASTGALTH